ncbi:MAG: ArsR family transcriptional regulator [Candidatus Thermoplasmatota archaeon]|jgi:predicted ArsR family transcriptional regulator|nr:ArsR family transcriptional regulator [Candidatus Thermoplasmatota archaeon]
MENQLIESNDSSDDISAILGSVRGRIINELSINEKSMDELAEILTINKNAVKEHMDSLEMKGYVKSFFRGGKSGRPRKFFELTEKGMSLFPKKYITLATYLFSEFEKEVGTDRMNMILGRIADRMLKDMGMKVTDQPSANREQKIRELSEFVSALNRLGYYARLEVSDDTVRIVRHNCIFYDIAKNNTKIICGTLENQLINKSIEEKFTIVEKFTEGAKKCVVEVKL